MFNDKARAGRGSTNSTTMTSIISFDHFMSSTANWASLTINHGRTDQARQRAKSCSTTVWSSKPRFNSKSIAILQPTHGLSTHIREGFAQTEDFNQAATS